MRLRSKRAATTSRGSTLTLTSSFITVDSGVTATISSNLAGAVGLTKVGSGTLSLAGSNNYSGGTTINGGVLGIASSSFAAEPASPTVDININNGATLRFNASGITLSANRNLKLSAGGVFDTAGNTATIAGVISGTALTKIGTGALILSGANTYNGGTIVNGGTLQINSDANLGAAPASFTAGNITLDGGTLRFGASYDLSNNRGIVLGPNGGTIDTQGFTNPNGYTQPNGITGTGDLTKLGSGTFFMNTGDTVNTGWKAKLVLKQGTWKVNGRGGLPYNAASDQVYRQGQITFDGGTLQLAASFSVTSQYRGIAINSGGGTFDTQANSFIWSGTLTGSDSAAVFNKIGSGSLTLNSPASNGPNNYAGIFNINGGTVVLNNGMRNGRFGRAEPSRCRGSRALDQRKHGDHRFAFRRRWQWRQSHVICKYGDRR